MKKPSGAEADLAKLTWFVEAAQRLNRRDAVDEILAALIDTTLELTHVERGFVFLVDAAGEMTLAAGAGGGVESHCRTRRRFRGARYGGRSKGVRSTS